MPLLLLLLASGLAAAASTTPPVASSTIGTWTGALGGLPQSTGGNLPHNPLLGNGYMGVQIASTRAGAPCLANNTAPRGPCAASNQSVSWYIGSNAMWGIYPATKAAELGPTAKGTRRAVGGVTLSGLESLFAAKCPEVAFTAEQRVIEGVLTTRHEASGCGTFTSTTYMDPRANVLVANCSWAPAAAADEQQPVSLGVSLWAFQTYPGLPPGQAEASVNPTSAAAVGEQLLVTRAAVSPDVHSPRPIIAALAVTLETSSGVTVGARGSANVSATQHIAAATATLTVPTPAQPFTFSIVTTLADNLHTPSATTEAIGAAATTLSRSARPSTGKFPSQSSIACDCCVYFDRSLSVAVAASATLWWSEFWKTAWVRRPTAKIHA